ncbi:MAG: molecular chaperone DnaJ [Parerythrobacter sp.]
MLKGVLLVLLMSVFCRWALGRWPWDYLRKPPTRSQAVFDARKLLAVPADASREDIRAAHKRLLTMVHPDRGGGSVAKVHEADAARDLLLDELPYAGGHAGGHAEGHAGPGTDTFEDEDT